MWRLRGSLGLGRVAPSPGSWDETDVEEEGREVRQEAQEGESETPKAGSFRVAGCFLFFFFSLLESLAS